MFIAFFDFFAQHVFNLFLCHVKIIHSYPDFMFLNFSNQRNNMNKQLFDRNRIFGAEEKIINNKRQRHDSETDMKFDLIRDHPSSIGKLQKHFQKLSWINLPN